MKNEEQKGVESKVKVTTEKTVVVESKKIETKPVKQPKEEKKEVKAKAKEEVKKVDLKPKKVSHIKELFAPLLALNTEFKALPTLKYNLFTGKLFKVLYYFFEEKLVNANITANLLNKVGKSWPCEVEEASTAWFFRSVTYTLRKDTVTHFVKRLDIDQSKFNRANLITAKAILDALETQIAAKTFQAANSFVTELHKVLV